jgi:low temperature requirement protein LtrA
MRAVSTSGRARIQAQVEDAKVAPIELFFDLVFVFSLTQVTALMASDLTPKGVLRGLLVLGLLWWCWVGYAWLGNVVRADEGAGRVAMFGAMAAMFVLALAIPESFKDLPGGVYGPLVVAAGYFAVRILHLAIFWFASSDDPGLRRQLLRFTPSVLGSTALLVVASQLHGTAQTATWAGTLLADYVGTIMAGASGWRLRSASHFAERHGLILIVALGESIVAIGVGVAGVSISWPIVLGSTLGLVLAACLWWAYFDVVALVGERVLYRAEGEERARLARDSYSYLHLPMIAGVVLLALGLKKVLELVGGEGPQGPHDLSTSLELVPLSAMYGGVALYLLAHVAFRFRNVRTINVQRVAAAVVVAAVLPAAAQLPALGSLALLVAIMVLLIAFEAFRFADVRERVRHEEGVAVSELTDRGEA